MRTVLCRTGLVAAWPHENSQSRGSRDQQSIVRRTMGQINTRYAETQHVADETSIQHAGTMPADPLRFCIFTTIALIAWVLGPPLAVALMSGLGLWAYIRAWQQGLRSSRC